MFSPSHTMADAISIAGANGQPFTVLRSTADQAHRLTTLWDQGAEDVEEFRSLLMGVREGWGMHEHTARQIVTTARQVKSLPVDTDN